MTNGFVDRTGETKLNNQGIPMTIKEYNSAKDILVTFEDGYEKRTNYNAFRLGSIANPNYALHTGISYNENLCAYYFGQIGFIKAEKGSLKHLGFGNRELDLYCENLNGFKVAIEYDGYTSQGHSVEKDSEKDNLCKKNGIILYRIREPQLPTLDNSYSKCYVLTTGARGSTSLIDTIKNIVTDINGVCNTNHNITFSDDDKDKISFATLSPHKGEKKLNNRGLIMEISDYRGYDDIDVFFPQTNTTLQHRSYREFEKGEVFNPDWKEHFETHKETSYMIVDGREVPFNQFYGKHSPYQKKVLSSMKGKRTTKNTDIDR